MSTKYKLKILAIDDQPSEVEPIKLFFNNYSEKYELDITNAEDEQAALKCLEKNVYDLIFLDIIWEFDEMVPLGIDILKNIKSSIHSSIPILIFTNYSTRGYQKTCLDLGCDGFLDKDRDVNRDMLKSIEYLLEKALRMGKLRAKHYKWSTIVGESSKSNSILPQRRPIALSYEIEKKAGDKKQSRIIWGTSKSMHELFQQIIRIAAEPEPPNVLIIGETGVGKSTIARAIHYLSDRSNGPFHEVILNTIPASLIESTLFGIESKIATDVGANTGIIEECANGTLFLDEIGELPMAIQVKLLRAIREKTITHVGGKKDIAVNFNLISATNQDLRVLLRQGGFRLDLFQRLCGIELSIPTLEKRFKEDRKELDDLLKREMEDRKFKFDFTPEAKQLLLIHDWPGNYAEFKTLLDNISLESTTLIDEQMLSPRLLKIDEASKKKTSDWNNLLNISNHKSAVSAFKREHVNYWINKEGGNLKSLAAKLEIDESTIHRILNKDQE